MQEGGKHILDMLQILCWYGSQQLYRKRGEEQEKEPKKEGMEVIEETLEDRKKEGEEEGPRVPVEEVRELGKGNSMVNKEKDEQGYEEEKVAEWQVTKKKMGRKKVKKPKMREGKEGSSKEPDFSPYQRYP